MVRCGWPGRSDRTGRRGVGAGLDPIAFDPKLLRRACLVALRVAAEGEAAEPRFPAPPAVRPVLGFTRLSAAAYNRLRQALEDDPQFRARVAGSTDESEVGRAGWLWLTRPEGWEHDPVFEEVAAPDAGGRRTKGRPVAVDQKITKLREKLERSEQARARAVEQRAELATDLQLAASELADQRRRLAEVDGERSSAVRSLKKVESDLAQARHELRLAREATRQAEADLLSLRSSPRPSDAGPPGVGDRVSTPDLAVARRGVADAALAAAEMAKALEVAADALRAEPGPEPTGRKRRASDDAEPPVSRRSGSGRERRKRRAASIPPGIFADSVEAHRHLAADPGLLIVVDGYNLARAAWIGLTPEEERRRTVALLEETATRSGGSITVVFDGADDAVAPAASRVLRVQFSATGVTADDDISSLLGRVPADQPVLVVSSDKAVAADARNQGATVLSSQEFLVALGR